MDPILTGASKIRKDVRRMANAPLRAIVGRADDGAGIQQVLAEYCHAIDESRFEDFEELFTEDAVVTARLAGTIYRGPSEIRAFLEAQPPEMRGLHVTVNPNIEVDGPDGRVRADFFVIVPRGEGVVVGAWGRYRDRLRYENGRWLFRERRIETQWRLSDIDVVR
jgi:SnoaL-like domain